MFHLHRTFAILQGATAATATALVEPEAQWEALEAAADKAKPPGDVHAAEARKAERRRRAAQLLMAGGGGASGGGTSGAGGLGLGLGLGINLSLKPEYT